MYQYRAILKSTDEIIAEAHTVRQLENAVLAFKRQQKKGIHTHGYDRIDIYHMERKYLFRGRQPKLIKSI